MLHGFVYKDNQLLQRNMMPGSAPVIIAPLQRLFYDGIHCNAQIVDALSPACPRTTCIEYRSFIYQNHDRFLPRNEEGIERSTKPVKVGGRIRMVLCSCKYWIMPSYNQCLDRRIL